MCRIMIRPFQKSYVLKLFSCDLFCFFLVHFLYDDQAFHYIFQCCLFGKEIEGSIPLQIEKKEAERFLSVCNKGSEAKLTIDTTDYDVLVKEVDYDPIKRQTLEIDFQVLTEGEKVHSVAEIVLVNHDKVQGVVEQHMEEIPYKAAKSALVEKVSVDIGELKPGDSIKVGDLDIAKDKDVSISPDVLEKVIVSVTEQTYAETDTDTDEDGEASEA